MSEEIDKISAQKALKHQQEEAEALNIDVSKVKRASVEEENDAFSSVPEDLENLNGVTSAFHFNEEDDSIWKQESFISAAYMPWRIPSEFLAGQPANPNLQAPREAKLLVLSILRSSFTMSVTAMPYLLNAKHNHPKPYTLDEIQKEFHDFGFSGDSSLCSPEKKAEIQKEHWIEILKLRNGWGSFFSPNTPFSSNYLEYEKIGPNARIFEVHVLDGFHRKLSLHLSPKLFYREKGYIPCSMVFQSPDQRIATTIQMNRARGSHQIDVMSDLVVELKRRRWTDEKIMKQLGMEKEEIYRLQRTTGLASLFEDEDFNDDWELAYVRDLKKDSETESIDNTVVGEMQEVGRVAVIDKKVSKEQAISTAKMMEYK